MPQTTEEIVFPGGVTIDHDALAKAIKSGKSPDECVAAATVSKPAPEPETAPAPASTSEKE